MLKALDGPEIVFGLIGPIGIDLDLVCAILSEELSKVKYKSKEIRISSLMTSIRQYKNLSSMIGHDEDTRIKKYMQAGTDLRKRTKRGDVLALLAVSAMRDYREDENRSQKLGPNDPLFRTAFILRSLKHPHEIETLRDIYGRAFIVISAYSPREKRMEVLSHLIGKTKHSSDFRKYRATAEKLINIDEEEGGDLGQDVRDAFPLADLFVDARSKTNVKKSISRFIELLFGYPYHSPTKDEFGMFHARSAALRSADLSRQVGSVIASKEGDVIAVGCNEVPKALGGLYWCEDGEDYRDFQIGFDSSAKIKREIFSEILHKFKNKGWLSNKQKGKDVNALIQEIMCGEHRKAFRDTQIMNLLEFGRIVHAEMAALMDSARRGVQIKGATLYSTTFPCHMCARHIIAAGIDRVVYIEPYPKSMAKELYNDSITVDADYKVNDRVNFEPFVGIAPRQYMTIFEMLKRKDKSGNIIQWKKTESNPRIKRFVLSFTLIEQKVVGTELPKIMKEAGYQFVN